MHSTRKNFKHEDFYPLEQMEMEFAEVRRFSACEGTIVYFEKIFEKILMSAQWFFSFEYMELRAESETVKCKTDKAILKALIRQCAENMKAAGDYISYVLIFLEKQPLPKVKQAEIRVRLVHAIKDMIERNDALSLISWKDKKLLGEFCMLLLDEAECYLFRSNEKFANKQGLINEILEFYVFMQDLNYFDSIFYREKWREISVEKICHYERLLVNT